MYKCNSKDVINTLKGKEDEVTRYRIYQQKQQEKEMKRVRRRELAKKISLL